MFDSNSLLDWAPNPHEFNDPTAALEERLGLYRVFLKLYEHNRELLDEILDLENTDHANLVRGVWHYVQATANDEEVFLTTNLLSDITQVFHQPQHIWVIGRDRKAGMAIDDKRLSRRHAMIQYQNDGFYLVDLNSTNGSFVNGEQVRRSTRLKHGDRIRLGSLSFLFFIANNTSTLPTVPAELLSQMSLSEAEPEDAIDPPKPASISKTIPNTEKETYMFLQASPLEPESPLAMPHLSTSEKAEILDRFFDR
jgi:pSer/pThr/pTyr-binding forkhead associated (FHA) protein